YVRDYLLEPESGKAEGHRYSLLESRNDMDSALAQYRTLLNTQEAAPFQVLTRELTEYWSVLEPVFQWTTEQRRRDGYTFLRDEVFPDACRCWESPTRLAPSTSRNSTPESSRWKQ